MEWEADLPGEPSGYEVCPECGRLSFIHDEDRHHHICVNEECGFAVSDEVVSGGGDSVWTRLLRILRIKK